MRGFDIWSRVTIIALIMFIGGCRTIQSNVVDEAASQLLKTDSYISQKKFYEKAGNVSFESRKKGNKILKYCKKRLKSQLHDTKDVALVIIQDRLISCLAEQSITILEVIVLKDR